VTIPWFDIIEILKKDPRAAFEIPADIWEEIIAGAYKQSGFDKAILTPRSGDYGRDVIAEKKALGTFRVIDHVKAFTGTDGRSSDRWCVKRISHSDFGFCADDKNRPPHHTNVPGSA
jgi:hypothetical protein